MQNWNHVLVRKEKLYKTFTKNQYNLSTDVKKKSESDLQDSSKFYVFIFIQNLY